MRCVVPSITSALGIVFRYGADSLRRATRPRASQLQVDRTFAHARSASASALQLRWGERGRREANLTHAALEPRLAIQTRAERHLTLCERSERDFAVGFEHAIHCVAQLASLVSERDPIPARRGMQRLLVHE